MILMVLSHSEKGNLRKKKSIGFKVQEEMAVKQRKMEMKNKWNIRYFQANETILHDASIVNTFHFTLVKT